MRREEISAGEIQAFVITLKNGNINVVQAHELPRLGSEIGYSICIVNIGADPCRNLQLGGGGDNVC